MTEMMSLYLLIYLYLLVAPAKPDEECGCSEVTLDMCNDAEYAKTAVWKTACFYDQKVSSYRLCETVCHSENRIDILKCEDLCAGIYILIK